MRLDFVCFIHMVVAQEDWLAFQHPLSITIAAPSMQAKAFDHVILDSYIEFVRRAAQCFGIDHSGRQAVRSHSPTATSRFFHASH